LWRERTAEPEAPAGGGVEGGDAIGAADVDARAGADQMAAGKRLLRRLPATVDVTVGAQARSPNSPATNQPP
jgi:hypothetical protein